MAGNRKQGALFTRRGFIGVSGTAALAAAGPQIAFASTPKKGGHLRVAVGHGSTTDSLDPATFVNGFMQATCYMIHNHLSEFTPDGDLIGEVAESWEASPDARVWTYKLRDGVTFHNGKSVTSEDVVASLRHHMGEDSKSNAAALLSTVVDLKTDGENSFVATLSGANADFPFLLADSHFAILPSENGKVDPFNGIGCGPYVLENYEAGVRVSARRNENYWKPGRAHFDSVEILSIIDPTARTNALLSDQVDLIDSVDLKTVPLLKKKQGVYIDSVTGNQHYTIPMLTNTAPFDDRNIRMALKLSVDREEMVKKILHGNGVVGNDHPISPNVPFYAEALPQRTYDPEKAKWHLGKAGHSTIKVKLSAADAAFTGAVDASVLYRESAARAGIDIEVVREPNDGYWANVWRKKPWSWCYWPGIQTVDGMLSLVYLPTAAWNDTNWKSPRLAELVEQGRAELAPEKRAEIYYEAQELISNDGGTVVPMYANYVTAASNRLAHGKMAANWNLDGAKFTERWWFVE